MYNFAFFFDFLCVLSLVLIEGIFDHPISLNGWCRTVVDDIPLTDGNSGSTDGGGYICASMCLWAEDEILFFELNESNDHQVACSSAGFDTEAETMSRRRR